MRAAVILLLACAAAADDAAIAKAREVAKAGPAAAREAIPDLIAIGKGSAWERFAARDALVVAGPPAIARLIEGAAGDGSLRLLLEGVSFDLGAGVVAPALPLLSAESPKVRAMAAVSLGAAGRGGEAAVKQLVAALHDKDADARREAANALGLIGRGAHDAIPGLLHLANDPGRGCQREALLAMGAILRDAAERERPEPKLTPEVALAIDRGLAWLAERQEPEGSWELPGERARVTSLAALTMLDCADSARFAPRLRSGLRYLVGSDALADDRLGFVVAVLCAGTRATREPECRVAAERGLAVLAEERVRPGEVAAYGWRALASLEAGFAGFAVDRRVALELRPPEEASLGEIALTIVVRKDPEARTRSAFGVHEDKYLEPTFFSARARSYVELESPTESILKLQREDGSWDGVWGQVHATACMVLTLEAASGLARPLTLPLPDAPQFRAAVATLRIAAQSKDAGIRAAAEQALAGFAVR